VSVAVTAPKSDPSGPTAIGAPSNANAGSDAPLTGSTAPHRAAGGPELSEAMQAWNGGDNAQTRLVQSARLGGNLRESEMNIAMQTETLGAVELRARVSGDVVGAAIGIERHDAHAMISNDLPSLREALHERQLRVGNVTVYQGSLHSGVATGDGGKSSQQRETAPRQPANSFWTSAQSPVSIGAAGFSESSEGNMIFDSNGRLSVRA
jgi:flagellar hook-length control protein FliK